MSDSPAGEEQIGQVIRRLRKERGLTQADLAAGVGRSRSLIQQIENGTRIPPQDVREHLSSLLGEALSAPGAQDTDRASNELRMQFNVLLGKDPVAVARAMAIAQNLIDAAAIPEPYVPLREIAERQLEQAEEVLQQVPSGNAQVREWNTVHDWLTVLRRARTSVRAIQTADLGTITGDVGDEYLQEIVRLAQAGVSVRRLYVVDAIEDVFAYGIGLWRQARAGVDASLVDRRFAPNAPSMLVVDDGYVVRGDYDFSRRERSATRFSALKHDIQFAIRGFDKLAGFRASGKLVDINDIVRLPELAGYQQLDEKGQGLFRAALRRAWEQAGSDSDHGGAGR
ncbi:helix-turn-helix domain-containing protein [Nocardia sp. NPDC055321]